MTQDLKIEDLNTSFKMPFNKHGWKRKNRYYHLTTTENFIYHLPKIKDRTQRQLAYDNLLEYLTIINEISDSEEIDARSADELFSKYLQPLINIYDTR